MKIKDDTTKRLSVYRWIIFILFIIGVGIVAGGIWGLSNVKRVDNEYVAVIGKIEKIEKYKEHRGGKTHTHYQTTVSYKINGKMYTEKLGAYRSSMREGDAIQLRYNPQNPNEIRSVEIEQFIFIVMIVAGVIVLVSDLFLPRLFRRLSTDRAGIREN